MQALKPAILAVSLCLLSVTRAEAGLYNPSEPDEGLLAQTPDEIIRVFRPRLWELRSIGMNEVPRDNPLPRRYVLVGDLAQRPPLDQLTLEQKISLSAIYLRRNNAVAALDLLRQLSRQAPNNVLVLSNLAMAHHRTGDLRSAYETMLTVKRAWPEQWSDLKEPQQKFLERIGWHQGIYEWNHKVELYYAKLLRSRLRESSGDKKGVAEETVDPIFDDGKTPPAPIRFVGASGQYEVGRIAAAEKAKLPRDAADIVQQLLIWLPDDNRLYWLLGEVYNARGTLQDLQAAREIFDDLVDLQKRQYRPRELVEHYRILQDQPITAGNRMTDIEEKLNVLEEKREATAPFDWRNLLVGFGAGLVVAVFGLWQVREIRRRRQLRQPTQPVARPPVGG